MNRTQYINKMENEGLLSKGGFALDLGTGAGKDAIVLAELGYLVEAVDKDLSKIQGILGQSTKNIKVIQADVTEFPIDAGNYGVIICSNVLPFISDKAKVKKLIGDMARGLVPKGVLYFSVFGPRDAWTDKSDMSFFEQGEILDVISTLPLNVYEKSTTEGYGKTMSGDIKYWHIHRFLCTKPDFPTQ